MEDAFRISGTRPEERELILEVVELIAWMGRLTGLLGIVVILAVAWAFSRHKKSHQAARFCSGASACSSPSPSWFSKPISAKSFRRVSAAVAAMLGYSEAGASFLFGDTLGKSSGSLGTIFAFQVLPIIIFIASFFAILYYLGIMQWVVKAFAIAMQKIMGASGAESLNVAASIFMGQTEAPLTIRPFLAGLTQSELFTIMVSGMAHVSGAVMAAYVMFAHVEIQHLLTAVIMTAPATIMLAKIIEPETDTPVTAGKVEVQPRKHCRQHDRRRRAGRGRRPASRAEYRGDADRVSGADCAGQRRLRQGARAWSRGSRIHAADCSASYSRPWPGCWASPGTIAPPSGNCSASAW